MANTSSARKATRKIARRTEINQSRRSKMRTYVRKVEEAIASGDRAQVLPAGLRGHQRQLCDRRRRAVVHAPIDRQRPSADHWSLLI